MNIGDLVIRKIPKGRDSSNPSRNAAITQRSDLGHGLVLSKHRGGSNPSHACVTVYYTRVQKTYDIAENLMEVISDINVK
jgi:hypothetical protein